MRRKIGGIVITGFMGTGKSSVGKALAVRLGMQFLDVDDLVEEMAGMTIKDIFVNLGEERFREIEKEALAKAVSIPGRVIATGGGAVMDEENRRLMKGYGLVVNLIASPEEIEKRVRGCSVRPLLKGGDLRERIEFLLRKREKYYEDSDVRISTDGKNVEEVVEEIIRSVGGEGGSR